MNETDFRVLTADIARLARTTALEGVDGNAHLEIDGINFTLIDADAMEEGSLAYFCDFGAIPDNADRAQILQRLLECNLLMFGVGTPTFSINVETGHAMLMGRAKLAHIDAPKLMKALAHYATQARHWQQHHFLDTATRTRSTAQHRLFSMTEA
jgi:hypothetical protein